MSRKGPFDSLIYPEDRVATSMGQIGSASAPRKDGKVVVMEDGDPASLMLNALKVVVLDKKISAWLKENDPKALEQVQKAIKAAEGSGVKTEALSKKYYIAVAEVLKKSTNVTQVALGLADVFAADNPQFDRARFLTAAGAD